MLNAKDLRKLKRSELFELLVEQAREIESYQAKLVDLEKRIEYREAVLGEIGSIAEASLAVTRIFEEAQLAANIYLEQVQKVTHKQSDNCEIGRTDEDGA
ncbi:TPA: DNA repair protein [Streptococcus suis]|nr:DNA repair protein [Streptococcus suis]HEM6054705.1 DNA repair protein [Streptococcus suis]HEM6139722.1 DNA repair protein [Streptococcus suis]HEM6158659.1 DNA repair protein [Streptococcus suis]HEM6358416.1 DNA repair protein [Streptococcus suis]